MGRGWRVVDEAAISPAERDCGAGQLDTIVVNHHVSSRNRHSNWSANTVEDSRSKALSEIAVELLPAVPEKVARRTPLASTMNFAVPSAKASLFHRRVLSGAIANMLSMAPTYPAVANRAEDMFGEADIWFAPEKS